MGVLGKIAQSLKGKKKNPTYITKMPGFESEEEMRRFISKKLESENAELKAQMMRKDAQIEKFKKEVKEEVVQGQINQEVLKQKEKKKQEEKKRSIKLKFVDPKQAPRFYFKSNKAFHRLAGVHLQETENGGLSWYPWLVQETKYGTGTKDLKLNYPAGTFEEFFKEKIGIVSQIRGGKVDSNYDITGSGKLVLKVPQYINQNNEKIEAIQVINLRDTEKKEYEDQIEELNNKLGEMHWQLKQQTLKEADYQGAIAEAEVSTELAEKEKSIYASQAKFLSEKQAANTEALATAQSAAQDLKIQQVLESGMTAALSKALNKMKDKLGDRLSMNDHEVDENRIMRIARNAASETLRSLPQLLSGAGRGAPRQAAEPAPAEK